MVGWVGVVGWGGLLVLYLKDVIAERQYSSMVFHGDSIELFHSDWDFGLVQMANDGASKNADIDGTR